MGSENSPILLFSAVLKAAIKFPHAIFIVFIDKSASDSINSQAVFQSTHPSVKARLEFYLVNEIILMTDDPLISLKEKKNSSLIRGLQLLNHGLINAFVTSGNTGALVAGAALLLPLIGSIKRPALLAHLPTKKGKVSIIDVGGSVECRASHLIQFAQMGIAYHRSCGGKEPTKVGLLNVGVESKKGTLEIRKAYDFFNQAGENFPYMKFVGNIEGREVFQGGVDVLITDGFAGNVLLKTAEGVYSLITQQLEHVLEGLRLDHRQAIFQSLRSQFDYEECIGAIVCGVDGIVVKCHGNVSDKGIYHAISGAIELVENGFIDKIKNFV